MKSELFVIVFICSIYFIFTDAQNIIIEGDSVVEADGGKGVVITCKAISGTAEGENPNLQWFDKNGIQVTGSGRISSLPSSLTVLKLLINNVQEDDSGNYNCTGVINGQPQSAHVKILTKMPLEVTEEQAPRIQYKVEGEDAQIKCAPQGDVTVNWKDRNGNIITSTHDRYVVSNVGYMLIPKINRTDDGVYQCIVVADMEFKNIDIQVIVTVPPKIVRPPTGQSVSVGEPARFECLATAKPEPQYHWYKDDGAIELAGERYNLSLNTGVFIIKSVIKDDKGSYKCRAFSRNEFDDASAILNVLVPPSIVKLDNATGDEGTSATIKCTAYGEPIPEIKWQKQGSDSDFSDGTQQDNNNIVVSHIRREDRMEVEGTLEISNLAYTDAGFYTCKATNEAKTVEKNAYLTVQYKPNFSKVKKDVLYSWGGQSTGITCIASSVPSADIAWYKGGQQINPEDQYYSIPDSITVGEDTTSTLTVTVDFSNEGIVFGTYTCKAFNAIGESTKNFTLQRADPPTMPSANLKSSTPISVTFDVNIPKAFNGPPVTEIEVAYTGAQPIQYTVHSSQSKLEVAVDGLTPNTDYTFNIYATNEVGKSAPFSMPLKTLSAREPYPIVINSNPYGDRPLRFPLNWNTPNNGGYPVTNIYLRYAQVKVLPDKAPNGQFQREDYISGWMPTITIDGDATSYELTNLSPSTYYEVEVTAKNREGTSDPQGFIFVTSKEKLKLQGSDDSVPLGLVIAIIIIIVIILFIVIDVTCYYKKQCGVFFCIKERVGRTGSMETRSKDKIMEEGDGKETVKQANGKDKNGLQLQDVNKTEKSNLNDDHKDGNKAVKDNKESAENKDVKQNGNKPGVVPVESANGSKHKESANQKPQNIKTDKKEAAGDQKVNQKPQDIKADKKEAEGVQKVNQKPQDIKAVKKETETDKKEPLKPLQQAKTKQNDEGKKQTNQKEGIKPVEPNQEMVKEPDFQKQKEKPTSLKQNEVKPTNEKDEKVSAKKQLFPVKEADTKEQNQMESIKKVADNSQKKEDFPKNQETKKTNIEEQKAETNPKVSQEEIKEEKKEPLLSDNKDAEDTDGEQEVGETVKSEEKEPEDKEEKPATPEPKDVEEAEEAKQEDQEKPASPKDEVKEVTEEKKE